MVRLLFFLVLLSSILLFVRVPSEVLGEVVKAEVKEFPGYEGPMPSKHYAGYITLGDHIYKKHFYYYFATSERNPSEDPVTIFFMGGPGCSGVSALVYVLGPFRVVKHADYLTAGPKVELNPFSWTRFTNVIVVDSPTFAGYSYAEASIEATTDDAERVSDWSNLVLNVSGTSVNREIDDTETILDLYKFVMKWFSVFPEFLSNPFYVAGSSYGGVYVAAVANEIAEGIEAGNEPLINFKGYSCGNAAIDVEIENNARVPFAHRMGLISDELYEDLIRSCKGKYWNNDDADCLMNLETFEKHVAGINGYHILCLPCHTEMKHTIATHEHESIKLYHSLQEKPDIDIYCFDYDERARRLFNPQSSREKLHAHQEEVTGKWLRCPNYSNYKRDLTSVIPYHQNLIKRGYRAFIYTGDHDMTIPPAANLEWIKRLNYTVTQSWRPWFAEEHVAGYMVQYDNKLLFATFKGGGHIVEDFMPHEAFVAHERWQSGSNSL